MITAKNAAPKTEPTFVPPPVDELLDRFETNDREGVRSFLLIAAHASGADFSTSGVCAGD